LPADARFQQVNCAQTRGAIKICRADLQNISHAILSPQLRVKAG
jgi:hypothetical protein